MTQQPATEQSTGFLRNDRKLVCSMLALYGLCILSLIAATMFGLNRRRLTLAANATSTAFAVSTQQAKVTATAMARTTEQAHYEIVESFNTNRNRWRSGREDSDYWIGHTRLRDGVYLWEVNQTKETFISWADFTTHEYLRDFDVYVDTQVTEGGFGEVCSGIMFRISRAGWDEGGYYFSLCNNSIVNISYHTEKEGWERIAYLPCYQLSEDWNRLEISARGSHFDFFVNGQEVYEMDDTRRAAGSLALAIEVGEKAPAKILFDNFGLQRR